VIVIVTPPPVPPRDGEIEVILEVRAIRYVKYPAFDAFTPFDPYTTREQVISLIGIPWHGGTTHCTSVGVTLILIQGLSHIFTIEDVL
jgi:hypothetical protein